MTTMLIAGHRGAMAHAPENSLESYALAEQVGVDEIELDVRLSADRELFLLHDATLDRTAGDDSARDRKSTRLNSSHVASSYAVFCLNQQLRPRSRPPSR